jgi:TRAP-type C4-dicarboxylate transport system substrate-binding protein
VREKSAEAAILAGGVQVNTLNKELFEKAVVPVYAKHVTDPKLKDLVECIRAVK